MGKIIVVLSLVCTILCIMDILKQNISTAGKIIVSVLVLLTSWVGLLAYYFWARQNLTKWFK